jgi:hypothetical protein
MKKTILSLFAAFLFSLGACTSTATESEATEETSEVIETEEVPVEETTETETPQETPTEVKG